MNRTIDVIGVQMDMGASRRGVNMGPSAIRFAGLIEGLRRENHAVNDLGDLLPKLQGETASTMKNYEQVIDVNRRLYDQVRAILQKGHFPVVLGGDHSIAAGSAEAVVAFYGPEKTGLIWIDAHGDWNNEETSASGNMHGMPFSALCGHGPDCMVTFSSKPIFYDIRRCVQIGGRDIEKEERKRMKEAGLTVFSIDRVDRLGIAEVIRQAVAIASEGGGGFHVSFDIDAVTPDAAPGTGTPVHSGLTAREAFTAAEMLAASGHMVSMDMVEVNPMLDDRNKTGLLASELIQSALGKSVY